MAYPTDDTVRQKILENVATTLEGINGAGTYRTAVQKVAVVGLNAMEVSTYPFIAVGIPRYEFDDGVYPLISTDMRFSLLLVIRTGTNAVAAMHDFLSDVQLALQADVTRGGYAGDTHVRGDAPFVPEDSSPIYGTEVEIHVQYRHHRTDPALAY